MALDEIKRFQPKINAFKTALDNTISGLKHLRIGDESLSPGECEIGAIIPRNAVKNRLDEFTDELGELNFILNTFSEISMGTTEPLKIKTISSTELSVYLEALPPLAACLAFSIERIVTLYKQLLEIRKLKLDLEKQGVPKDQTRGISDHANNLMAKGIESLTTAIMTKFNKQTDPERKNELTIQLGISLNKISNRIDQGYNIEVRVEPLSKQQEEEAADPDLTQNISVIQNATPNMQFMKLEGSPILHLPEKAQEKGREKKETKTTKT